MNDMVFWLLVLGGSMMFIGLIRIIVKAPPSFGDGLIQLFLIDFIFQVIGAIIEVIADGS